MAKRWDRESIRLHLERKCKGRLTDEQWTFLIDRYWVDDVENGDEKMEWLIDTVRQLQAAGFGTRLTSFRKRNQEPLTPRTSNSAAQHAQAAAEYFGALAAEDARVRIFRREVIGGIRRKRKGRSRDLTLPDGSVPLSEAVMMAERATMGVEDAWGLLESPAAAIMSADQFATFGIEIVGHQSEVLSKQIDPSTGATHYSIRVVNSAGDVVEPVNVAPNDLILRESEVPAREGGTLALSVYEDSILGELSDVSRSLSASLPWSEPLAAWFVLTGEVPPRAPVEAGFEAEAGLLYPYTIGRITLSIDAAVAPSEVEAQYSQMRRRLIPGRVRECDPKTLAVFRFVNQTRLRSPGRSWPELVHDWDANCSPKTWSFGGDAKRFRTYWERGKKAAIPKINIDATESGESRVPVK